MSTEPYDPLDDDTTAGDRDHPSNRGRGWLTPNVRTLCGVSFLQDAASELLYPVLPIFLTTTLGAPVAVVGIIEGAAEGVAAATKLVAGRLGDTRARRPLITLGYGLAAVGKVLSALAVLWPVVLAGRAVDRVGKGIRGAPATPYSWSTPTPPPGAASSGSTGPPTPPAASSDPPSASTNS